MRNRITRVLTAQWDKTDRKWYLLYLLMMAMMILLFAPAKSNASEDVEKSEPIVTITSQVLSSYVDDNGAKYVDGPVIQSSALLNLTNGLWVEVWNSQSLKNSIGRELDLTLGLTMELLEVEFEIGATYIDLEKLLKSNEGDLWAGYLSAKKNYKIADTQNVIPFVKIQGYLPVKGNSTLEKGFNVMAGVEHGVQVMKEANFAQKVSLLYDDGALGYDRALVFAYEVGIEAKIIESISFLAAGRIITPITGVNDGRKTEVIPSAGVKFEF